MDEFRAGFGRQKHENYAGCDDRWLLSPGIWGLWVPCRARPGPIIGIWYGRDQSTQTPQIPGDRDFPDQGTQCRVGDDGMATNWKADPTSWRTSPRPIGWGRIRAAILQRDPVCTWGFLKGELAYGEANCREASTDVDHIGSPDDHDSNSLRGLCSYHHAKRTASQGVLGRARIRQERPRVRPKQRHPGIKEAGDDN
jgi:hypothetical protein